MINLLLDEFPVAVFQTHILTFLSTVECLKLDTACANKELSHRLRSVLWERNAHKHLSLITPNVAYWMVKRKITIKKLTFHPFVFDADVLSMRSLLAGVVEVHFNATPFPNFDIYEDVTSPHKITDRSVITVAKCCPSLLVLNLNGCVCITDRAMRTVALHCKSLQQLEIAHCKRITDPVLKHLMQQCPRLRSLNVSFTTLTLTDLAASCTELEKVNCRSCRKVTDSSIAQLVSVCPHLTFLDCADTVISRESIQSLMMRCPALTHLNLNWCYDISALEVTELV